VVGLNRQILIRTWQFEGEECQDRERFFLLELELLSFVMLQAEVQVRKEDNSMSEPYLENRSTLLQLKPNHHI